MRLTRRAFLSGSAAVALSATTGLAQQRRLFDSHCHIIDHRFPIVANQGYTPPHFPLEDYLAQAKPLGVVAGAVVSGSFQAEDQTYLMDILPKLGPAWVGVTQIPNDYPDAEIAKLGKLGVRAVRFNVFRGRIDSVDDIVALATRAHSVAGWHSEIYADAAALAPHVDKLSKLPQLCVDHLGMTEAGVPVLLDLVAAGCKVKATGFGRVKLDVPKTLEAIAKKSPNALVFGTDIPSTRAARPFEAVRHRSGRARARPRARPEGVLGQSARALQGQGRMKIKANGITFNFEISGRDNAPWLIFSNSLATNLHMWDPQAADLKNEFRMLRYDQRGHGETEATVRPLHLRTSLRRCDRADGCARHPDARTGAACRWAAPPAWVSFRSIRTASTAWCSATIPDARRRKPTSSGRSASQWRRRTAWQRCWNRPCSAGFRLKR